MTKDKLMQIIDIETGSEFTYFENLAAMIETDEEVTADAIFSVLAEVDMKTFAELVESYFYDIMEHMPEDVDVYNILEAEKRNLVAMSEAVLRDDESALSKLADEMERFHEYFSATNNCEIINHENGNSSMVNLRDAIYDYRISKLGKDNRDYDISGASNYEISEYIVSLGDL